MHPSAIVSFQPAYAKCRPNVLPAPVPLTALVMALIDWPIPNIFPFTHSSHVAILTDNNPWNIRIWTHHDMVSQQTAFCPKLAPDLNP